MNKFKIIFIISVFLCLITSNHAQEAQTTPVVSQVNQAPLTILYDDLPDINAITPAVASRAFPYLIVYQSSDPDSAKSGLINIENLLTSIRKNSLGGLPEWGILDFEDPFFEFLTNKTDSIEFKRTVDTMVQAMRAVKIAFPNTKWTYYGMPGLRYWIGDGQNWVSAPDDLKRKVITNAIAAYSSIVSELDWLCPSIYGQYDPSFIKFQTEDVTREQGRAWRFAQVGLAKMLSGGRPVIPIVCPWWTPGGAAFFCRIIEPKIFVEDIIIPAIRGGAKGFALWGALNHTINLITDPNQDKYKQEKNFGTKEWRAAVVFDYFKGNTPSDWSAPEIRAKLVVETSKTLIQTITSIRNWECLKTIPK